MSFPSTASHLRERTGGYAGKSGSGEAPPEVGERGARRKYSGSYSFIHTHTHTHTHISHVATLGITADLLCS
jgi:hypothetical protein